MKKLLVLAAILLPVLTSCITQQEFIPVKVVEVPDMDKPSYYYALTDKGSSVLLGTSLRGKGLAEVANHNLGTTMCYNDLNRILNQGECKRGRKYRR